VLGSQLLLIAEKCPQAPSRLAFLDSPKIKIKVLQLGANCVGIKQNVSKNK